MSADLPLRLDPFKAADRGSSFHGRVPLAGFTRLAPELLDVHGDAEYEIAFYRDISGVRKLRLVYRADLVLRCERCLGPLLERVEGEVVWRLVDEELETAGEDEDALPVGSDGLHPKDVLEEELLLVLPLIPRHESLEQCEPEVARWLRPETDEGAVEAQTENPFDILKTLKH